MSGSGDLERGREFSSAFPTLVPPTVADFETTKEGYEKTPEAFKTAVLVRMLMLDNPGLVGILKEGLFEPDSNPTYRWAFIYYGTIERAAHNANVAPLKVSVSIAKQYGETRAQAVSSAIKSGRPEEAFEAYK